MALNFSGQRKRGKTPFHDDNNEPVNGFFFGQSSFGTSTITYERNLVKVGKDISLEVLGPLGCGLQTGAGAVFNVMRPSAGQSIAVFGTGPVGLAAIMAAKASGCTTIIAIDILDNKLKVAQQLGATHTINSKNGSSSELILNDTNGDGVHFFLDTTARNEVIAEALKGLQVMGKGVLVGAATQETLEIPYAPFQMGKSVQYVLSGDGVPDIFIPQLITLYKKGLFPFDKLITFYEFEDLPRAVEDFEKGVVIKAILKMPR